MNLFQKEQQFFNNTFLRPVEYHGLLNEGATSYLNSVLQVLFMTKDFREAVGRHSCENPDTECIDPHLNTLFDDLKRCTAYTYNITKKLGIDKVNEERDAAEYFEKILSLTSPDASKIFHGLSTYKTICSSCHTETGIDETSWHLPLAFMDSYSGHYSVLDGIEDYFKASEFKEENQMYCEHCDAKSDATSKHVMKHHPEVLMLLLKRFEFDYRYMTYVKINRTVDVPHKLQIPENQTYELYAVVDHSGGFRSGHYTATIKANERWYNFNDERVTSLDYQQLQIDNLMQSRTAYLLFYRKINAHAADTCTQDTTEESRPQGFTPVTINITDQREDDVKMKKREEDEREAEVYTGDRHQSKPRHDPGCRRESSSRYRGETSQRQQHFGPDVEEAKEQGQSWNKIHKKTTCKLYHIRRINNHIVFVFLSLFIFLSLIKITVTVCNNV